MEEKHYSVISVLSIANHEKKGGKYVVSLSDGDEVLVSPAQIADFQLYVGREFSSDEYSDMVAALNLSKVKSRAVKILGSRNLSAAQVKDKLIKKGENEDVAQSATDWLSEIGLIDDEEYTNSIIDHYKGKGYGPLRIKSEMYRRGISQEMYDEALLELTNEDIMESAQIFLAKKLRDSEEKEDIKRAHSALIRRGFTYEQADSALRRYLEES